jgi:hypothetical protein
MTDLRYLLAALLVPFMRWTGFRFSKGFRHGVTPLHRAVYACVDTVWANGRADGWIA